MDFDRALAELDTLIETLQRDGDERALHLLQLVDAIHRPALERIADGDLDHPMVQALLMMYGHGALDEELLAEEALDEVRPYIESHGGDVELLRVEDGRVHVRLSGACVGCAGSTMTLKRGIEEVLREHLPGFREVVAEEPEPALLQIETVGGALPMASEPRPLRRPVFVDVAAEGDLAAGELRPVDADGASVLLANAGGELYAVRNGCALDGLPLEGGRLTADGVVVCPWHNCAYDIRTGRRADDADEPGLAVVPLAVQDGVVKVAVNVA